MTDEETALCNWLIELSRRSIPVQKKHLLDSIQQIITTDGRQTPFVNNRPGSVHIYADTRIWLRGMRSQSVGEGNS